VGQRILIVEDHVDTAAGLAQLISAWGHEAHVAHDGHAALELAQRLRPDIVLLDIGLPGMDGYELARALRKGDHGQRAVLVALTGYRDGEDERRLAEAGLDHHLVKPVDLEALELLLRRPPAPGGSRPH
jgi:CheY-like chemotaxis protein